MRKLYITSYLEMVFFMGADKFKVAEEVSKSELPTLLKARETDGGASATTGFDGKLKVTFLPPAVSLSLAVAVSFVLSAAVVGESEEPGVVDLDNGDLFKGVVALDLPPTESPVVVLFSPAEAPTSPSSNCEVLADLGAAAVEPKVIVGLDEEAAA